MQFDNFVNRILKENLLSIPSNKKKEVEQQTPTIKKISDIGAPPQNQGNTQQQTGVGPHSLPQQQGANDKSENDVEELVKQMTDAQKEEQESAEKLHDDFAKLIATLTATQKVQQPASATQTTQTPQNVISSLQKGEMNL
jgi:hypothetical protein